MAQTILLFELGEKKRVAIEAICRKRGIRAIPVAPADYGQTLGTLARIDGFPRVKFRGTIPTIPDEMLVFSGMDSEALDGFLNTYKRTALAPVALKAVLTPHNINWKPDELYAELVKEHQKLKRNISQKK